ncbi:nuclear transport factor 2 family protein [Streptomyces sp. NPDC041068]|uniref:nuclear transport factor 2 family protein n=1 Tax=Streptomyces sp. NPDC041068 TaxID=3155130 RepID=UPI0033EB143E
MTGPVAVFGQPDTATAAIRHSTQEAKDVQQAQAQDTRAHQPVDERLHSRVVQFYARQMQALDAGRFPEYADSFTEDGVFQHTPGTEPARTRAGILAELLEFNKKYEADPVQRRHYFSQVLLEPQDDGTYRSTVYALIVRTRSGERPEVWPSCVVNDVVVEGPDGIHLKSRHVTYD